MGRDTLKIRSLLLRLVSARWSTLAVALILLLSAPCFQLHAAEQLIGLVCSGTIIGFEPQRTEATVSPGATTIDLEQKTISTPIGKFRIKTVDEASISFEDAAGQLVFGYLDRFTGRMRISWRSAEEVAKMLAGKPWKESAYSELTCELAKRRF